MDLKALKELVGTATPFPWKAVEDAQGTCGLLHAKKRGVAVAWFSSVHSPANGFVGEDKPKLGRPERESNAKLIEAIPEMIAEIERLNKELEKLKV